MSRVRTRLAVTLALALAGCGGVPEMPPLTVANPSEVPDLVESRSAKPPAKPRKARVLDDSTEEVVQ